MPRIVIDARELNTSTGRYVERLLHYLQRIDKTNDYIVLLKPQDFEGWRATNPRFKKIACRYKEFTFGEQLGYLRQLRNLKADLVHFPMVQQPVFYRGKTVTAILDLTTARFRNPAKNPVIFSIKQIVYKWLVKRVARKSRAIIAISEFAKNDIASYSGIDKSKIVVAYPASDKITANSQPMSELAGNQYLLYVGRALPHKNLNRLVDAYQELKKDRPDLLLVFAGKLDDNYRLLRGYAAQNNVSGIVFTDFISDAKLRWLYENSSAYVFPSLSEGFGLPGLEAMLYDLPVVSSSATCLPEIYGEAAYYFDPLDVNGMAEKISDVLSDAELRGKLIKAGKNQAAKYSWQKMAEQTLQVYKNVLSK